jgi:hypothetical protein
MLLATVIPLSAAAQNPPTQPPQPRMPMDSMRGMMPGPMQPGMRPRMMQRQPIPGGDPQQAMRLQEEVRERFAQRVQMELNLTDQQMDRLRVVSRSHEDRMRELGRREEDLQRAVRAQLQPGVPANQDSLSRLLDALASLQVSRAQASQQELRELGQFLTPVQRARLVMMRRQFEDRVRQVRERFRPMPGQPGPGPSFEDEPDPPYGWGTDRP